MTAAKSDYEQSTLSATPSSGRLEDVVATHFDPEGGSRYWLERERALGIDARDVIREPEDLDRLGILRDTDLVNRSAWDFVPQSEQTHRADFVYCESGGTLGRPKRTLYAENDFHAAFVAPFLSVANHLVPFPEGAHWLWIGPSGPHAIGKAVGAVCRGMGSPDPYSVDLDPRWFKAQTPGSVTRTRYLQYVVEQALQILNHEPVEVLFGTPPLLVALGHELSAERRDAFEAVHLGGLSVNREEDKLLRELYPRARFLAGYGNSLFGVSLQVREEPLSSPSYYPHGDRLWMRVVREPESGRVKEVDYGERGRVLGTRLDRSFLIVNLLERDTVVRLRPPAEAVHLGFRHDGLGTPESAAFTPESRLGIY